MRDFWCRLFVWQIGNQQGEVGFVQLNEVLASIWYCFKHTRTQRLLKSESRKAGCRWQHTHTESQGQPLMKAQITLQWEARSDANTSFHKAEGISCGAWWAIWARGMLKSASNSLLCFVCLFFHFSYCLKQGLEGVFFSCGWWWGLAPYSEFFLQQLPGAKTTLYSRACADYSFCSPISSHGAWQLGWNKASLFTGSALH